MKKFYTAMAMLACAAAAVAVTPMENQPLSLQSLSPDNLIPFKAGVIQHAISVDQKAGMMKVGEDWTTIGDNALFEDQMVTGATITATLQGNGEGSYQLVAPWAEYDITSNLVVDASNPECVKIPLVYAGYNSYYKSDLYVMSFSSYMEDYGYEDEEIIEYMEAEEIPQVIYYADYGIIEMPGEGMVAYFPDYGSEGAYMYFAADSYIYFPGVTPFWSDLDTEATWTDGILSTLFSGTQYAEGVVTVQKFNYEDGYYRIVGPWNTSFNGNYGGYLEFYMGNPECVMVPYQGTGISGNGIGEVYIASASYIEIGTYTDDNGQEVTVTVEDFLAGDYGEMNIAATIEGDNVTIDFAKNACWFNCPDSTDADWDPNYFYWMPDNYAATSCLKFKDASSGISSVVAEETGEAVYYNIQGVQVANPQAGQIYIVKQGSKVSKQILR